MNVNIERAEWLNEASWTDEQVRDFLLAMLNEGTVYAVYRPDGELDFFRPDSLGMDDALPLKVALAELGAWQFDEAGMRINP